MNLQKTKKLLNWIGSINSYYPIVFDRAKKLATFGMGVGPFILFQLLLTTMIALLLSIASIATVFFAPPVALVLSAMLAIFTVGLPVAMTSAGLVFPASVYALRTAVQATALIIGIPIAFTVDLVSGIYNACRKAFWLSRARKSHLAYANVPDPEVSNKQSNVRAHNVHIPPLFDENNPPAAYNCAISFEPINNSKMTKSGYTYENDSIIKWLKQGGNVSPRTREVNTIDDLRPNLVFDEAKKNPLTAFTCHLAGRLFEHPYTTKSGNTYEGWAIKKWLHNNGNTSPRTCEVNTLKDLRPNRAVKETIEEYSVASNITLGAN